MHISHSISISIDTLLLCEKRELTTIATVDRYNFFVFKISSIIGAFSIFFMNNSIQCLHPPPITLMPPLSHNG
jgi:hypothetical protein